jgi:hypothetical protein
VLLTIAGVLMTLWRIVAGPTRVPSLVLLGFSVVYFVVMARSFQIFGRYLVPLLPAVAVIAAIAAVAAATWLRRVLKQRSLGISAVAAVMALMLAPPAMASWTFSRDLGSPTTNDQAYRWITKNVPPGSTIVVEAGALQVFGGYTFVVSRSLPSRSFEDYVKDGATYILAAAPAFQAMLRDPAANRETTAAYRGVLDRTTEAAAFEPSATVSGPSMRIYRIPR